MFPYQQEYIDNTREVLLLCDMVQHTEEGFDQWYASRKEALGKLRFLRDRNNQLLRDNLFPALDTLYSCDEAMLQSLNAFADALMDWTTNLDCGIYVQIHDAMLTYFRVRKDRDAVIREMKAETTF